MNKVIKILVVEDEILIAMQLEKNLIKLGYNTFNKVNKGEDAITIAQKIKPDIILLDIRLAGKIDGIEAAEQILSFYKPAIIFMTGYSDEELKIRAEKLNPLAYFIKPINILNLQSVINASMIN